jgi:hypothetical protein
LSEAKSYFHFQVPFSVVASYSGAAWYAGIGM